MQGEGGRRDRKETREVGRRGVRRNARWRGWESGGGDAKDVRSGDGERSSSDGGGDGQCR